ncbi:unnamed protein product [Effrenium voratum]|uniref:Uncharacterized protein n=1 Tax=Effrenium voratum TaxID=2562239 RepID=A0AA36IHL9_9DINO|nr:unnamed protein product [Effrenium voratum]CAJ1451593.1 unnamed protein product [Effrenium voratum]
MPDGTTGDNNCACCTGAKNNDVDGGWGIRVYSINRVGATSAAGTLLPRWVPWMLLLAWVN